MLLTRRRSNETAFTSVYAADTDVFSYNKAFSTKQSLIDIQQANLELSSMGYKNMVRQKLFGDGEKVSHEKKWLYITY
jgi:hypothetical protein